MAVKSIGGVGEMTTRLTPPDMPNVEESRVGENFGPFVAGLLLAFPSIMLASVTLLEKCSGNRKVVSEVRGITAGPVNLLAFGRTRERAPGRSRRS